MSINLGFEPQFVLAKPSSTAGDFYLFDVMRGMPVTPATARLSANSAAAEVVATSSGGPWPLPTATGFDWKSGFVGGNETWIYIAIRRPMKTPESGTEVFSPVAYTGNSTANRILTSSNNPVDLGIVKQTVQGGDWIWTDRLRGAGQTIYSNYTQAEAAQGTYISGLDVQSGIEIGSGNAVNNNTKTYISYMLSRATGAFDAVAYTGDGTTNARPHNLGVVPELMICKWRANNTGEYWYVYHASLGVNKCIFLQLPNAESGFTITNSTAPTSTHFTLSGGGRNTSNATYIAYLFATLAGVSKVGSVVHSGTTNVDCGFSAGARFVMAKRTDASGDWFVWSSASGISAGNDPYVRFNTSDPYVSSSDFIDPLSSGFTLTSSFTAGTYIFLAIA